MKKLLLPILLLVIGTGSGVGAALLLKPPPEPEEDHAEAAAPVECLPGEHGPEMAEAPLPEAAAPADITEVEYAELSNQFVIPVLSDDEVAAMVVISISIEVPSGLTDTIYGTEPKLRDAFLQKMFDHANIGGFSGNFTSTNNMRILRGDLVKSARAIVGDVARDVLITDIVRQDL